MDKTLQRQLKRCMNIADEDELGLLLDALQTGTAFGEPRWQNMLRGLGDFLHRVEATYGQYERDLELRTRALEISSGELTEANTRLQHSLDSHQGALVTLRSTLQELLPDIAKAPEEAMPAEDIDAVSRRIAAIVSENEHGRRALANQKFALDQHAIVSMTDTQGVITYANDRFCEISGYQYDELIGQNHRIVNSGQHPAALFRDMWSTIACGQVWHGELCNRAKAGHLYWVNATIVPLLDAHGCPESYIAIRTDISDRKRMEAQLSEQLHLVEALLEAIPLPVYLNDTEGRYIRLNRAFEAFFQVRREDFVGRTLHELLRPEDALIHVEMDGQLLASPGTQSYETVVHSRDGTAHDAMYRKATLTRSDGTVSGLLGVVIDITERREAEKAIVRAKEVAEAASRSKSEFLANMSHEIRPPLNGVIGLTALALETELTVEQREYLDIAKASAESLLTIINDILDFSKIEAGKLHVEQIGFDLHRMISDLLKPLALKSNEKHLELLNEILPDVPRFVVGDPGRIRQVITNLVGNAIKFTEFGEIILRTEVMSTDSDHVLLHFAVRDTGIGIAEEKQHQIFDAFVQEDTSTTRKYGGTGLGLSICQRLVGLMGGKMWLESEPGMGSTFHFSVRLIQGEAIAAPGEGPQDITGRSVLIVDDNATNRRILCSMLASLGATSVEVDAGLAAIALLEAGRRFDCIILDAQMPEMDGYQLARTLHDRFADLPPLLMLSSGAQRGDGLRCKEAGIAGFFSKPIFRDELLAAICRLFDCAGPTAAAASPAEQALVTRHALREGTRSLNILLVEDHPTNQKLAMGLLNKWGHQVRIANHGREALALFAAEPFDVILMDVQMPVMGGIEATKVIRARERQAGQPPTTIIAMTAAAMVEDRAACLTAGMNDYLSKPIKVTELQAKLQSVSDAIVER